MFVRVLRYLLMFSQLVELGDLLLIKPLWFKFLGLAEERSFPLLLPDR